LVQGLGVVDGHVCALRIADVVQRTANAFCERLQMLEAQFVPEISTAVGHPVGPPPILDSAPSSSASPPLRQGGPPQRVRKQYLGHTQAMPTMLAILAWSMLVVEAHIWGNDQRAGCARACEGVDGDTKAGSRDPVKLLNKIYQFIVPFSCCVLADPVAAAGQKGGKRGGQGKRHLGNYAVAVKHWLALVREKGVFAAIAAHGI
jgi:hypothetical protein